jgi:cell division protein FtsQ
MRRRSGAGKVIVGIVLAVLAIAGLFYFGYVFFQVEEIEVTGNGKYTDIYIEGLADIPEETHMLMLDEEKIKENIEEAEPYLEVLNVRKKLPKTVAIEVKERQPKTLIAYANSYLLTDTDANVLEILDALPEDNHMPVINGFSIGAVALGKQIATEDTFKITVMGEILTAFENRQLTESIDQIDLSDINNIRLVSSDGLSIKFGQSDNVVDKIKWIDKMLPTLNKEGRTTGVLDVSSGTFAVYKKDEGEQTPSEVYDNGSTVPGEGGGAPQDSGGQPEEEMENGQEGPEEGGGQEAPGESE